MRLDHLFRALRFASEKHRLQRRKDAEGSPYINHPIAVATVLCAEAGVTDETTLLAAVLHDTVEDTETSFEELEQEFGAEVSELVRELTDDKSLRKEERKRLQIEHARTASERAKRLKIADKISNVRDILDTPPESWSDERRLEYLDWAGKVVSQCRGVEPRLEALFDGIVTTARNSIETV